MRCRARGHAVSHMSREEFDRKQVLKNTELNSQLGIEGRRIKEQIHEQTVNSSAQAEGKKKFPKTLAPQALKRSKDGFTNVDFDEDELENWDKQRGQTEKIMEPNTPYMGTAADTEYYDDEPAELDLGKSA